MIPAHPARSRRLARATALVSAMLTLTGCGWNSPSKTELGIRRIGLDLAYSDEALRVKVPPRILVKYVPAPPAALIARVPGAATYLPDDQPPPHVPAPKEPLACPKAPAGAVPEEPAAVAITSPPVAGTYLQRNVGTIKVSGSPPLTFTYPEISELVIRDVKTQEVVDPSLGRILKTTFVAEDRVLPTYKIVSKYEYDTKQVNLLERSIISGATTTTFHPSAGVEVVSFGGPGATWDAAGVDTDARNTLVVQGSIAQPEVVDVCGMLVDSQKVSTDENQVDVANASKSGSRAGMPIVTHYAMQFGGLPVRRDQHTTQVIRTDAGPVTVDTDVVSTLMSIHPLPPEQAR